MDTVYRIVFAFLHSQTTLPSLNLIKTVWGFFSLKKKKEKNSPSLKFAY